MASPTLSPWADDLDDLPTLGSIARVVLDVRMAACLLTGGWVVVSNHGVSVLAWLVLDSALCLSVVLRWDRWAQRLLAHPAVHVVWLLGWFVALRSSEPVTPLLVPMALGLVVLSLCLDWLGAMFFLPFLAAGWLAKCVAAGVTLGYVEMVLVPAVLVACLMLGAGIRRAVLAAETVEVRRRAELRRAGVSEERARVSRELHDTLIKSLHGIVLLADALPQWVHLDPERAGRKAEQISELLQAALEESRTMLVSLRRTDAEADLAAVLTVATRRWQDTTGRPLELEIEPGLDLGTESTLELVSVVNEAMANIAKHTADDVGARVEVSSSAGWIVASVIDHGTGIPDLDSALQRPAHYGLRGMQERAMRIGGRLTFDSTPGGGCTVRLRVPARLTASAQEEV